MRKIVLILLSIASVLFGQTENVKKDSLLDVWDPRGALALNISQIALSNWAKGGENAITWTVTGDFGYNYKGSDWSYNNNLKFAFGKTKLGSDAFRTNDNEIYLENVASKNVGWPVNPFISSGIRTSITTGYKYTDDTFIEIADFFDPGYVTQSLGFTYVDHTVNTRLGIALQETFTNKFRNFSDDEETKDKVEAFKLETGLETVTNLNVKVAENILYKSLFRLFTRFDHLDVWDVRFDNTFTAKISKFINVNLNVLVIYEQKQAAKTQLKEALQLGFVYTLF